MRRTLEMFSVLLALALVLGLSLVVIAPVAAATPIYVNGTTGNDAWDGQAAAWDGAHGPKHTIQAGVNVVDVGGTVYVAAGTYSESVTVNKAVTLTGDRGDLNTPGPGLNAPVLDGTGLSAVPGFRISSGVSNVIIEGFEIRNYGPLSNTSACGVTGWGIGMNNIAIRDNYIHNIGYSAVLSGNGWGGAQAVLNNWAITYNVINNHGAYAIDLENAGNSLITRNQVSAGTAGTEPGILVLALACGSNSITVANVTISANQFANYPDRAIWILAWASDATASVTLEDVAIIGNVITGSFNGILACKYATGTAVLRDLTINGNSYTIGSPKSANYAIDLADVAGTSTFSGNNLTITGAVGGGGTFFHGINIGGASTGDWTITNNNLDDNAVGPNSAGIRLRSTIPASASLEIECNTITEWARGIHSDALPVGTTVDVHSNNIMSNSGYGVFNGAGATIDTADNWWGDDSGPYHSTNPTGTGNPVSDNVVFTPWIDNSVTTATATGTASFATSDGNILGLTAVMPPATPPVMLPHGMFSFTICCIDPGETVTVTVTLPANVPIGTKWWKYQNGGWYSLPNLSDDGDAIMVISLTDAGSGDEDSIVGQITDDGGPGAGEAVGWETYPVGKVRVLLPWIALGVAVAACVSLLVLRRRRPQI